MRLLCLPVLLSLACAGEAPAGSATLGRATGATSATVDGPGGASGRAPVRPARSATPRAADTAPVATWEGGSITAADLHAHVGDELRNQEIRYLLERYEVQSRALDVLVMERLLQDEVERRGLQDVNALLRAEVDERVPEPTEAEIEAYWPVVERRFRGATLDEARPVVVSELVRRAREQRYAEFVQEMKARNGLQIVLPYPDLPKVEVPVEAHDPHRGPSQAPVTIVQFAEYQCYYCNKVEPTIDRLFEAYPGQIKLVWKDYPLSNHGRAMPSAVAAHCAGEQGHYWEMSEMLLANQHAMSDGDIAGYARDLGLSPEPFQTCMSSGRYEPLVLEDQRLGKSLGIEATPTFFVNGVLVSGAQPYDRFRSLVERELR